MALIFFELFCMSKSNIIISTLGGAVPTAARLISKKKLNFINGLIELIFIFFLNT